MDGQIKPLVFFVIFLLVSILLESDATFPKISNNAENEQKGNEIGSSSPKPSFFPEQLDISSLQNMPLVILHPRTPINFQMLPGQSIASLHQSFAKSLNPSKVLELLQSATFKHLAKSPPLKEHENRQARDRKLANLEPEASVNRPQSVQENPHLNTPALPRSLLNSPANNGWFQRFRGSFSNMFPSIKPFQLGLPSMNSPVFLPHQNPMYGNVNPYMMPSHNQFHGLPWRTFFPLPSMVHSGDLTQGASYVHPTRMLFGNTHLNPFRSPASMHPHNFGGDLATSGSAFIPHRILPIGHSSFPRFRSPLQRHKPLFNNFNDLRATSMEISNAFADFTDSKEHGPGVTQRFGSVGHTINNFLKMMGLGADGGLGFGDVGGFGGGSDMASMESTPIARSMDFYPGYGNQAHLDDVEDFPFFNEDITEDFMKKMNLTNATMLDVKELEKELSKKEAISPLKLKLESTGKGKSTKDSKHANMKDTHTTKDLSYASAVPLDKEHSGKYVSVSPMPVKEPEIHQERPVVNYKIPSTHSTVSPGNRIQPVAIYQHFPPQNKTSTKPTEYAPAQALPQSEAEANPNKLVNDNEVRQWRLVNSGQGYVEKQPIPIVDILKDSMQPESLKILQKVLSGDVLRGTI